MSHLLASIAPALRRFASPEGTASEEAQSGEAAAAALPPADAVGASAQTDAANEERVEESHCASASPASAVPEVAPGTGCCPHCGSPVRGSGGETTDAAAPTAREPPLMCARGEEEAAGPRTSACGASPPTASAKKPRQAILNADTGRWIGTDGATFRRLVKSGYIADWDTAVIRSSNAFVRSPAAQQSATRCGAGAAAAAGTSDASRRRQQRLSSAGVLLAV